MGDGAGGGGLPSPTSGYLSIRRAYVPLVAGSAIGRNEDGGDDPEHQSCLRAGFPAVRAGILSDVRGWWKGDVIPDDHFVSQDEARQVLGLRSALTVGQLVAR